MAHLSTAPARIIGCDVGKKTIVVHDGATGTYRDVPNRPADLRRLAKSLGEDCLVVCEATGGYESELLTCMLEAHIPVHRADARKVKNYIRSLGTLAKSDKLDAKALADYGRERWDRLRLWEMPDPVREELQALVHARQDLMSLLTMQRNRLSAPGGGYAARSLTAVIKTLEKEIAALEKQISALIRSHAELARDSELARSVKGVGEITSSALLAFMPELGTLSGAQAASLAGTAPHPDDSGDRVGQRRTRGGRPQVKRVLFMAALSAARAKTGPFRALYQRLRAKGKKPIVAMTAVMRKIIVIINARIRDARRLDQVALTAN